MEIGLVLRCQLENPANAPTYNLYIGIAILISPLGRIGGSLKQTFGPPWGIFGISHFKLDGIGNIVVDTEHETLISCKFIQNR